MLDTQTSLYSSTFFKDGDLSIRPVLSHARSQHLGPLGIERSLQRNLFIVILIMPAGQRSDTSPILADTTPGAVTVRLTGTY